MLGFLGDIGRFLGGGLKQIGGGIKSGVGKLGKLDDKLLGKGATDGAARLPRPGTMPAPNVPMTPGINASASLPEISLPDKPSMPPLTGTYQAMDAPDKLGGFPSRLPVPGRATAAPALGGEPSGISMPSTLRPTGPQRSEMPIPRLPGRGGEATPYTPEAADKYDFVMERPGRSWKTSLQSALIGANEQYQKTGDWGSALGGAVGGGVGGTINPTAGREQIYEAKEGPAFRQQQQDRQQHEDRQAQTSDRARRAHMDSVNERLVEARTRREQAATEANSSPYEEATWGIWNRQTGQPSWERAQGQATQQSPYASAPGIGIYNRQTGDVKERLPMPQKPVSIADAEADRAYEEGSVEQISQDSLQGRLPALFSQLPPEYQKAISNPAGADTETAAAAARMWEQIQQKELSDIRRYTEGEARKKAGARRTGGGLPAPAQRASVSRAAAEEYAREKGVSVEEAIRKFQAKGIQVR